MHIAARRLVACILPFAFVPIGFVACGTDESPAGSVTPPTEGGSAALDAARDGRVPDATVPADGGGVCCPLDNPCSPNYHGGWAPTPAECEFVYGHDGKFDLLVDDHGCPYWSSNFSSGQKCCGCVQPPDASVDAAVD